jgi:hypothetical protein
MMDMSGGGKRGKGWWPELDLRELFSSELERISVLASLVHLQAWNTVLGRLSANPLPSPAIIDVTHQKSHACHFM